jgi:hypothetical protein
VVLLSYEWALGGEPVMYLNFRKPEKVIAILQNLSYKYEFTIYFSELQCSSFRSNDRQEFNKNRLILKVYSDFDVQNDVKSKYQLKLKYRSTEQILGSFRWAALIINQVAVIIGEMAFSAIDMTLNSLLKFSLMVT